MGFFGRPSSPLPCHANSNRRVAPGLQRRAAPDDHGISQRPNADSNGGGLRTLSANSAVEVQKFRKTPSVSMMDLMARHGEKQNDADAMFGGALVVPMDTHHGQGDLELKATRSVDTTHSMAKPSSLHVTVRCLHVDGSSNASRFQRMAASLVVLKRYLLMKHTVEIAGSFIERGSAAASRKRCRNLDQRRLVLGQVRTQDTERPAIECGSQAVVDGTLVHVFAEHKVSWENHTFPFTRR